MSGLFRVFDYLRQRRGMAVGVFLCGVGLAVFGVREVKFQMAVRVLAKTKPIPDAIWIISIEKDPKKHAEKEDLFKKQLTAVATIHRAHKEVDLAILFPCLVMTTDARFGFDIGPPHSPAPNLEYASARFTVFEVIVDLPGAAQALEKYSLSKDCCLD